jgi:hypothetical protein
MIIALLIAIATATGFTHAHTSAFDREIALWHKKATMQCVMLKDNPVDDQQILKNLSELETELKVVTDKYINKPPAKYAKDVNWKSYFQTLSENIVVVRERVEKKQFAQASIYCSTFCKTFEQMHKINGTTDLTDVEFSWRMEIKNTSDMLNAGNTEGANQNLAFVESIYKKVIALKAKRKRKNNDINEIFKPIDEAYTSWINSVKANDIKSMNVAYKCFMDGYTKLYMDAF